jgi:uncharacterized membrane protein
VSRYEWLLFLHVLSAFALVASLVIFTTLLVAARGGGQSPLLGVSWLGSRLWDVGGLGTLVFGVWMAIDIDNYDLFDGWILAALVLWVIAAGAGARVGLAYRAVRDEGAELAAVARTLQLVMILATTLLLVDMIFKPGA